MNILITADLHLSDRPQDSYRWAIIEWLSKKAKKHDVGLIVLLGDVTDCKDKHSEPLVNRLVDELEQLGKVCPVIFNPGNHDGIQEGRPFFRFSNHIHNVTCLTEPMIMDGMLFLPNTRDYRQTWKEFGDFKLFDLIFCHQTFDGCIAENGTELSGIPPSVFAKTKAKVYSGDIHVPQKVSKNIEYVGAPYRVRFGDRFEPRVLLLENGKQTDLHFPTVMKFLIELSGNDPVAQFVAKLKALDVREDDQIKVRVTLPRSRYVEWPAIRSDIKVIAGKGKLLLSGPELHVAKGQARKASKMAQEGSGRAIPEQAFLAFGQKERLSGPILEAGRGYLAEALGKA